MKDYEIDVEQLTKLIVNVFNDLRSNPYTLHTGISARHIHLTRESIETLFGIGYKLVPKKDLSQPGQFAAEETVVAKGPSGKEMKLRILGPERKYNQVEISASDARSLGFKNVPVRKSGDVLGTPGIIISGPNGSLRLEYGVIIPERHVHMTTGDASWFGVNNGDIVNIKVTGPRGGILGNTTVRVSDDYRLELHVDTDDGNAFGLVQGQQVFLERG